MVSCEKEKEISSIDHSIQRGNFCYTEEGLVYTRPNTPNERGKMDYLDYETGSYYPLCAKVNCRHNGSDCTAVHFAEQPAIGRLGDKWYRFKLLDGGKTEICSCDLDGGNEKTIFGFYSGYFFIISRK